MGKAKGFYKEEFPKCSTVKIASRSSQEIFLATWKLHNRPEPDQLNCAGQVAEVKFVRFHHGGDERYRLKGVPGIWREQWLEALPAFNLKQA